MPFSADTSPDARRVVIAAIRRMTPQERLCRSLDMSAALAELVKAGVRRDLPEASPQDRKREFLRRWLGASLAREVLAGIDPRGSMPGTSDDGGEALQLLRRVTALLDRLGVPYLVGGPIASTLFGEPRGTRDVDLVVELTEAGIPALAAGLEPDSGSPATG